MWTQRAQFSNTRTKLLKLFSFPKHKRIHANFSTHTRRVAAKLLIPLMVNVWEERFEVSFHYRAFSFRRNADGWPPPRQVRPQDLAPLHGKEKRDRIVSCVYVWGAQNQNLQPQK